MGSGVLELEGEMLHKRMLVLLGGGFLLASAARADDMGYVDCSNHPEGTQVYAKARKSPDVMGSVPCGERFTILLYGFIFSRVQTGDGKVGYVFSNVISVDRGGPAQRLAAAPAPAAASASSSNVAGTSTMAAVPSPTAATQPQPTQAQPVAAAATAPSPGPLSSVPYTAPTVVQASPAAVAQPLPTPAQSVAPGQAPPLASNSAGAAVATTVLRDPPTVSQPPAPAPAANGSETAGATAQPDPASVAQPEPAAAQPAAPAVRPVSPRESWERPTPGGRSRTPRVELFGGYAFARLDGGGGSATNLNGALGSFGWNIKSWLQLVADSSYSVVTISGTKNVLYGNHYGPRLFRRGRNRWGATPFVEALVGESRSDTTVSGVGGYTTSTNALSFKAGGGVDIHPSRHFEIRLLDVDYYRTSFGTGTHQNNYWASTGIVLRFFGGGSE